MLGKPRILGQVPESHKVQKIPSTRVASHEIVAATPYSSTVFAIMCKAHETQRSYDPNSVLGIVPSFTFEGIGTVRRVPRAWLGEPLKSYYFYVALIAALLPLVRVVRPLVVF